MTSQSTERFVLPIASFESDCDRTVRELCEAVQALYSEIEADAEMPQEVSRRFGLNKNLTWKIGRMLSAGDPVEALAHVPGRAAISILLKAAGEHTSDARLLDRVRDASERVDAMVQSHVGDRATLDLVLDGRDVLSRERLELSRRYLFLGASGVWGVQARTRVFVALLAPAEHDPSLLDITTVNGYHGLRRLQSRGKWPLFRLTSWGKSIEGASSAVTPLDPTQVPGVPHLLSRFSSQELPALEIRASPSGTDYLLGPGPVGNFGSADVFMGQRWPSTSNRFASNLERTGEFGPGISVPSESVLFDLYMHESLGYADRLETLVYGYPRRLGEPTPLELDAPGMLRLPGELTSLDGDLEGIEPPAFPAHDELVAWCFERLGWDRGHFCGRRLTMKYPPLGASVGVRFPLEDPPR